MSRTRSKPSSIAIMMRRGASRSPDRVQSGGGANVLRTMGLPVTGNPKPQPERQAQAKRSQAARPQQRPAAAKKLKPIPTYPETGADSWRSANDQVFIEAANKFNRERGLKPGDPKYVDPAIQRLGRLWKAVAAATRKRSSPIRCRSIILEISTIQSLASPVS